mgnify:CR=1 FL=1
MIKNTKQNNIRLEQGKKYLKNAKDLGKVGKNFELEVRSALLPNSNIIDVQKAGFCDIRFKYQGKTYFAEVKSESGEIATFTGSDASMDKRLITLQHLLQYQPREWIIYSIDGTLEKAKLISTKEFFQILLDYNGRRNSMFNWIDGQAKRDKNGKGRLGLSVNPKCAKDRREYLANAIANTGISIQDIINDRE